MSSTISSLLNLALWDCLMRSGFPSLSAWKSKRSRPISDYSLALADNCCSGNTSTLVAFVDSLFEEKDKTTFRNQVPLALSKLTFRGEVTFNRVLQGWSDVTASFTSSAQGGIWETITTTTTTFPSKSLNSHSHYDEEDLRSPSTVIHLLFSQHIADFAL